LPEAGAIDLNRPHRWNIGILPVCPANILFAVCKIQRSKTPLGAQAASLYSGLATKRHIRYNGRMKDQQLALTAILLTLSAIIVIAADLPNFTGEYADKKFLNGKAVLQMSLEQGGSTASVWFSAVYNDGHGAAPEAAGTGKITGKGTVEFKFEDSFKNLGAGTVARSGEDIIVSIKATRVADSRCLPFYGQNMRLKPAGKK
jgi:hypothetical protein